MSKDCLSGPKYCPLCGNEVHSRRYCENCGYDLQKDRSKKKFSKTGG